MMMKIEDFYTYINAQETSQFYLYSCYKGRMEDAEAKSYQNSSTFMYHIDHGLKFYENGQKADQVVQPVLYFYGMVHLLKAWLLTNRPDYPESTTLLAHGVTTRKRKKKQYSFMEDEVKLQQHGLFPYFTEHLFSIKQFKFEKIRMELLFASIPEMSAFFSLQKMEKMIPIGSVDSLFLQFPIQLLDNYHLTDKAFIRRIEGYLPAIKEIKMSNSYLSIHLDKVLNFSHGPFLIHMHNNKIYFPAHRDDFLLIPEVVSHYLILFNLSMLCRYEAEWWGDLLLSRPDIDYPFIMQFLKTTSEKIPYLLGNALMDKTIISS
ncbi:YaaC family protein [Oceanobacillus saliphilus]|uniref:YaaC family protein n=1 Tax=Oceanobacillus saliphilus TaxID=2925834 RepID=UPI00201E10D1|nr:YaaC family protein [Oceanobacillus saliphilus]